MAMKLVRKNIRGDLIRWLTHDEEMAVKNISGLRDFTDRPQHSLATQVLRKCVGLRPGCSATVFRGFTGDEYCQSVQRYRKTISVRLLTMNMQPAVLCTGRSAVMPGQHLPVPGNVPEAGGLITEIFCLRMMNRPQSGCPDVLNHKEMMIEPGVRVDRELPAFYFPFIENAGLNQLTTLCPLPSRSIRDSLIDLQIVTQNHEFIRGRCLSEIVRFQPGMGLMLRNS